MTIGDESGYPEFVIETGKEQEDVFVHYKDYGEVVPMPLSVVLMVFGDKGIHNKRIVDAWEKNGKWHFEVAEVELDRL